MEMEGLGLTPAASDLIASGGAGHCSPGDADVHPGEELLLEVLARALSWRKRLRAILLCFCSARIAQYMSLCRGWNLPCLSEG